MAKKCPVATLATEQAALEARFELMVREDDYAPASYYERHYRTLTDRETVIKLLATQLRAQSDEGACFQLRVARCMLRESQSVDKFDREDSDNRLDGLLALVLAYLGDSRITPADLPDQTVADALASR
ncbi:hypothetical protein P7L78_21940 [Tistrella bauzanensis]|uniref:hypothetical protein n=1 Tax=Tistrella TaxID=171436 RepID=UPI0031F6FF30